MNVPALLMAAFLSAFTLVAGAVQPPDHRDGPFDSSEPAVASSPPLKAHDVLGGNPTGASAR